MNWFVLGNTLEAREIIKEELFELRGVREYKAHFESLFIFEWLEGKGLLIKRKDMGIAGVMIRKLMTDDMVSVYLKSVLQKKISPADFSIKKVK